MGQSDLIRTQVDADQMFLARALGRARIEREAALLVDIVYALDFVNKR
jgi:hypothetical protein